MKSCKIKVNIVNMFIRQSKWKADKYVLEISATLLISFIIIVPEVSMFKKLTSEVYLFDKI